MTTGTLNFAGYTWTVRDDTGGPGPNNLDPNNVFVDSAGNLHLDITYHNGQWSCAELYTNASLGFGIYQVQLASPVNGLDKNVVLGLFNYPTPVIGPDGTNEIDMEFATWGGQQSQHGNWTVWPAQAGTANATQVFDMPSDGGQDSYRFLWTDKSVEFQAQTGHQPASPYEDWVFQPANSAQAVPQTAEPFHMNLWLFDGQAPSNGQSVDVVISGFSFTPSYAATFHDAAANYAIAAAADGSVTVTEGAGGQDAPESFSQVYSLAFADRTVVVAQSEPVAQLARLYEVLGRHPTADDLDFWSKAYASLVPAAQSGSFAALESMAPYFIQSPEFRNDFPAASLSADQGGPHDAAFIEQLYLNVLGRVAVPSEVQFWQQVMQTAGVTRAAATIYFTESPESIHDAAYAHPAGGAPSGWLFETV